MPYQTTPSTVNLPVAEILTNYTLFYVPLLAEALKKIFIAFVLLVFGLIVAGVLKLLVRTILRYIQVREWFKKIGLSEYFENFVWEDKLDNILAEVVFWLVMVVFLMVVFDVLGLSSINVFIQNVVNYIPRAVAGGLILLTGFIFGEIMRKLLLGVFHGLDKKVAKGASSFVKFVIIVFSLFAALSQWGVASEIINILTMGIVLFIALAGGLAFGFGGEQIAREILENLRDMFSHKS